MNGIPRFSRDFIRRSGPSAAHGGAGRVAACLLSALALGGCADIRRATSLDPGGVPVDSAVAQQVVDASRSKPAYVGFDQIPNLPKDSVPPAVVKSGVAHMAADRRQLNREVAALPKGPTNTEGFANQSRAIVEKAGVKPVPEDQEDQTEAFVAQIRAAAAQKAPLDRKTKVVQHDAAPGPQSTPDAPAPKP